jgi:hypothetical protein
MNKLSLLFVFILPLLCFSQVYDNFTDGDFSNNPYWNGIKSNFFINSSLQLQSKATSSSVSYLTTASQAFENASWECFLKFTYPTSSTNFSAIYLTLDSSSISSNSNAYFVQVGGTNDEVSLYVQKGAKKTKIIDGIDKRTDGNTLEIWIKVTRDSLGNFTLYSKIATESEYQLEGQTNNLELLGSNYFGLLFSNTSTTGSSYYFDNIVVTGNKWIDKDAPECRASTIINTNEIKLDFSEPINIDRATFHLDNEMGYPYLKLLSDDMKSVQLSFKKQFDKGYIYHLELIGIEDLYGNVMETKQLDLGIVQIPRLGDLLWNEIMFENPDKSVEYIELYNNSDKLLDVSMFVFTTRKADFTLNKGVSIPKGTWMLPNSYMAICENDDSLRSYFFVPNTTKILRTAWTTLNNDSASLVLLNPARDTVFDEVHYSVKWHHVLVKNPKGVALERINPDLPSQDSKSWHSASSEVNYGTPGLENSQFRVIDDTINSKTVWVDPEVFTPDNDGVDDLCFIHYKSEFLGYVCNAQIFNSIGNKVFQLTSNNLLSSQGFMTWDGKLADGKIASVGIYILYLEMFNPLNGDKKHYKIPIVVSIR